jgi:hypothetical protein
MIILANMSGAGGKTASESKMRLRSSYSIFNAVAEPLECARKTPLVTVIASPRGLKLTGPHHLHDSTVPLGVPIRHLVLPVLLLQVDLTHLTRLQKSVLRSLSSRLSNGWLRDLQRWAYGHLLRLVKRHNSAKSARRGRGRRSSGKLKKKMHAVKKRDRDA